MKLTKLRLKQIIKETIEEGLPGSGLTGSSRWVPTLPEPWKRPSNDLIDAAYQDISTIDAQRGIEAGTYKPEHVADALRTMAAEFDQAAEKEVGSIEREPDETN